MSGVDKLASRLTKRLVLQEPITTSDGAGGYSTVWTEVSTLWAEIIPSRGVRDKELFKNDILSEVISHKITIRYMSNINHNMRFVLGTSIFNIRAVVNLNEGKDILHVYAETGVGS